MAGIDQVFDVQKRGRGMLRKLLPAFFFLFLLCCKPAFSAAFSSCVVAEFQWSPTVTSYNFSGYRSPLLPISVHLCFATVSVGPAGSYGRYPMAFQAITYPSGAYTGVRYSVGDSFLTYVSTEGWGEPDNMGFFISPASRFPSYGTCISYEKNIYEFPTPSYCLGTHGTDTYYGVLPPLYFSSPAVLVGGASAHRFPPFTTRSRNHLEQYLMLHPGVNFAFVAFGFDAQPTWTGDLYAFGDGMKICISDCKAELSARKITIQAEGVTLLSGLSNSAGAALPCFPLLCLSGKESLFQPLANGVLLLGSMGSALIVFRKKPDNTRRKRK